MFKKLKIISLLVLSLCVSTKYSEASTMRASWYDCCGKYTASGERFNANGLTAAHRYLPFGTRLHLTYRGKSIIVRINDRGPFIKGRQLDLSRGAARALHCYGTCILVSEAVR